MSQESFQRLDELAGADAGLVATLIDMFFDQAPALMDDIKNALATSNPDESKRAAHTFKGVCLNLGFNNLAAQCKSLEELALGGDFDGANNQFRDVCLSVQALIPELKDYKARIAEAA